MQDYTSRFIEHNFFGGVGIGEVAGYPLFKVILKGFLG